MISLLKKILPYKYKRRLKDGLGVPSLHWTLQNLKLLGYQPSFVIDGGAYEGNWSLDFLEVFPGSKILMLEAQKSKEKCLKEVCKRNPSVKYHLGLLSATDGELLSFMENETASHVTDATTGNIVRIESQSLDTILHTKMSELPGFIKLDVQGFELEVLKGAKKSLAHAEFCLLEVSLLDLGNTPLIFEVMRFMDERNFQAYDISQFMRRPFDKALFQMDLLFIKKTSSFISEKRWD